MYDVCIRKNRHGAWVAVIKWSIWEDGHFKQKTFSTQPYPILSALLRTVDTVVNIAEVTKNES